MFANLSGRAAAATFIVLVLAMSAATATIAEGLILAISPAIVVLLMMLVVTREGHSRAGWRRLGLGSLGLRSWPLAFLTTAGVSLLAVGAVVLLGFARFTTPDGAWRGDLLALCVTGPVLALAEELGWRGYLQPRLGFLGERAAMLVVGLVWAAWHVPYIVFTPYYHADGARWLVLPLFTGSVIAFSFLIGRLRTMSGSVWPAVLAHFAHNASFAMLSTHAITTDRPVLVNEYLAGDSGLFVLLGTAGCIALIAFRRSSAPR
ncbi:CPBP family intramembrane metalloprotease [Actinoplanes sp. NEAU-A12]|uniref:CPBP family intramembrane metalloprotease n=1 Tax=Actinoplanes sandaracinus TaxID=3045177 RepID=A0ABT6WBD1_9ACTN|nr:CPBP family intramembrane glutamic endopeptidase [Actinoplanes sandaracinus]MDI6097030.1 CPBP family intramembrane metalloprotease [Actinoplanes sandaracinus]